MKISARNVLKGKILELQMGAVNSEVIIDVGQGIKVVSIITNSSVKNLDLSIGKDVYAVVKASDVMIATE